MDIASGAALSHPCSIIEDHVPLACLSASSSATISAAPSVVVSPVKSIDGESYCNGDMCVCVCVCACVSVCLCV